MVAPTQRLYSFAELGEVLPQSSGRAYASPLVLVRWSTGINRELPASPILVVQLLPVNFSCRQQAVGFDFAVTPSVRNDSRVMPWPSM